MGFATRTHEEDNARKANSDADYSDSESSLEDLMDDDDDVLEDLMEDDDALNASLGLSSSSSSRSIRPPGSPPASDSECSVERTESISREKAGLAFLTGKRRSMEDCGAVESDAQTLVAGIFDGHGGANVSEWLRANLCERVLHALKSTDPGEAHKLLEKTFLRADLDLLANARQVHHDKVESRPHGKTLRRCKPEGGSGQDAGSTATVAAVLGANSAGQRRLVVGWVGDSRAVLCRGGRAVPLTRDHRAAEDHSERERVLRMGGVLSGSGRLNHDINLSRAMGSFKHKSHDISAPSRAQDLAEDEALQAHNVLSSIPEVVTQEIDPSDEFVILASDGVWDVVENDIAVKVCRTALETATSEEAANALVQHAFTAGSADNLSAVVIRL